MGKKLAKDLKIYEVYKTPNGNLFIKLSDNYSMAIGPKGDHEPNEFEDIKLTSLVPINNVVPVKKVGKLVFK